MGNVTLYQVLTNGGVPTSVYAFTVEVTRNDTNAVVVPALTNMTPVTTGVYEHSFAPPAPGLSYTATYTVTATSGAPALSFPETINDTGGPERPPKPRPCGDWLEDTLAYLLWQRLSMLMSGPMVSYDVHGHKFSRMEYMQHLDNSIMALRRELAQQDIVEFVSGYSGGW
jgi:hypothetical protein